jgi:Tfp pilus assembly protein PilN
MKTLVQPTELWNTMPGWGIAVDLTPPELIASRRLRLVRRVCVTALSLLMLVLGLAYGFTTWQSGSASDALVAEQSRTAQLAVEQHKYGEVTRVHGAIDAVQRQVSGLMSNDVDLSSALSQLRTALPTRMNITNVDLVVNAAGVSGAATNAGANSLDTSGQKAIGKLQLSGTSHALDDLAAFVTALKQMPGVIDVFPTSNAVNGGNVQWSVTASLTDKRLSHRYDLTRTGSK